MTNMRSPETVNQLILVNLTTNAISAEWLLVPVNNTMTQTSPPLRPSRDRLWNWGTLIPENNVSLKKLSILFCHGDQPRTVAEFGKLPILATLMKSTTPADTSSPATFQCTRAFVYYLLSKLNLRVALLKIPRLNTSTLPWKMLDTQKALPHSNRVSALSSVQKVAAKT